MTARRLARSLVYLGLGAIVVSLSKVHAAYVADPPYDYTGSFRFSWSIGYIVLLATAAYGAGLPDLTSSRRSTWLSALAAPALAATSMSVLQLAIGDALLPRFVVLGSVLLAVPWLATCAAVAQRGRVRAAERDRVVVVAGPSATELLRLDLLLAPERPASIVAVLDAEKARDVTAGRQPLIEMARASRATVVVLDRTGQADDAVVAQAAVLHAAGVRVRTLSLFYEEWLGKLPAGELERVSLMFDIGELHRWRYGRAKRLADVLVAALCLPVLVVVIPLVLLGNLAGNRGPLLYRQPRVGRHGGEFEILKLRTMVPDGAQLANGWTAEDDPRITRFGGVLRRTHLDELPQLLNILKGELSLVGPRPEQPHYVAELTDKLPFYDLRHLVRPGLTGWAQVKYGYAGNEADALEKLQYEFFYLRRQGLAFDARILGRTLRALLQREGR